MWQSVLSVCVILTGVYLAAGAVFAAWFHYAGLTRVDPAATGAGWWFRLLITPGLVVLWPCMGRRWLQQMGNSPQAENMEEPGAPWRLRRRHLRWNGLLAVAAPLIGVVALAWRPAESVTTAQDGIEAVYRVPPPLHPAHTHTQPFGSNLPILATFRGDTNGVRQVELMVMRDLEAPAVGLFWSRQNAAGLLPNGATFLGPVWGPGTHRHLLPMDAGGWLYLASLVQRPSTLAQTPVPVTF